MDSATLAAAPDEVPSPARAAPGSIIAGRYRIMALLGKGASGEIYRATQIDLDREVALKLFSDRVEDGERERFAREAKITAGIRHPCIADVYDAGITDEGMPYCAMELLEGETLDARLGRDRRLDHEAAIPLAASVCSALQTAHAKGFLHRDIKPSNIFLAVRPDGGQDVKLLDFGIAKRLDAPPVAAAMSQATLPGIGHPTRLSVGGALVGTLAYSSPEQVSGAALDARSDVYALGATLYQALTGTVPFAASDAPRLMALILGEAPQSMAKRATDAMVPRGIEGVVLRALAKDPAGRYPTAADFATALWAAAAEARGATSPVELEPDPARRPLPRGMRSLAIVAALMLPLASLVLLLLLRAPKPLPSPPTSLGAAQPALASAVATGAPPLVPPAPSAPEPRTAAATPSTKPRAPGPRSAPASSAAAPPAATTSDFRVDDLKTPFH